MQLARRILMAAMGGVMFASLAAAAPVREEHVTGGVLDLPWLNGYAVSANMQPLTLLPADPGYANPSGDHTVACATSMPMDSGGIILTAIDPAGLSDYIWEAKIFTGDGNSRRGLVVRADPTVGFEKSYQFVIQSGLFQINFRKLAGLSPVTLGTWFATDLPAGVLPANTWHHMKVMAVGDMFRCYIDDFELTTTPIVDGDLSTGWVGVYNFRFDVGQIPFYTDDLLLNAAGPTPTSTTSWGRVKTLYRR